MVDNWTCRRRVCGKGRTTMLLKIIWPQDSGIGRFLRCLSRKFISGHTSRGQNLAFIFPESAPFQSNHQMPSAVTLHFPVIVWVCSRHQPVLWLLCVLIQGPQNAKWGKRPWNSIRTMTTDLWWLPFPQSLYPTHNLVCIFRILQSHNKCQSLRMCGQRWHKSKTWRMALQMTTSSLLARGELGVKDEQVSHIGTIGKSGSLSSDPTCMKDGLGV